jgi:hypothetical protein
MQYWTKDLTIDPRDPTQSTWYVAVRSGYGGDGSSNDKGGLYRTTNRGVSWTRIFSADSCESCAFNPATGDLYVATLGSGLWYSADPSAASPTFAETTYGFRQPSRIFFNPYDPAEGWVASFGNGLSVGTIPFASADGATLSANLALAGGPVTLARAGSLITASSPHGTYTFDGNRFGTVQITGADEQDALTVEAGASATFASTQRLGRLLVRGGKVVVPAGSHATLVAGSLSITEGGSLDLMDNALIIRSGDVGAVAAAVAAGYHGGLWDAPGLRSSTAVASGVTGIGYGSNATLGKTSFGGVSELTSTDVLVRYTYLGDADLSGATTLDDFTLFLGGYQGGGTDWIAGDFDQSGRVTLDDFTLFLAGYQGQGAPLAR